MKGIWLAFIALLLFPGVHAQGASITISCGAVGTEFELCKSAVARWAQHTGNEAKAVAAPNDSSQRLALYQQQLAAKSPEVDVLAIDVIWPGLLATHLQDLNSYVPVDVRNQHFPAVFKNNIVDGKLVAVPWFVDVGILYYRKDLLNKYKENPPETWDDLARIAKKIQDGERGTGNAKMWGYVFQGRAYEGLTCNFLEWMASYNQNFTDARGALTLNAQEAARVLAGPTSWIDQISPKGVLNYMEEESRGVFQAGNAVFMRNWPYAWSLLQGEGSPVQHKVGVSALPKGGPAGRRAGTLGGWGLAVSKYSRSPKEAADLVLFLTSEMEQRVRALEGGFHPTLPKLYSDKVLLAKNPLLASLFSAVENALPRPTQAAGLQYNRWSTSIWNAVHDALSGRASPNESMKRLSGEVERLNRKAKL